MPASAPARVALRMGMRAWVTKRSRGGACVNWNRRYMYLLEGSLYYARTAPDVATQLRLFCHLRQTRLFDTAQTPAVTSRAHAVAMWVPAAPTDRGAGSSLKGEEGASSPRSEAEASLLAHEHRQPLGLVFAFACDTALDEAAWRDAIQRHAGYPAVSQAEAEAACLGRRLTVITPALLLPRPASARPPNAHHHGVKHGPHRCGHVLGRPERRPGAAPASAVLMRANSWSTASLISWLRDTQPSDVRASHQQQLRCSVRDNADDVAECRHIGSCISSPRPHKAVTQNDSARRVLASTPSQHGDGQHRQCLCYDTFTSVYNDDYDAKGDEPWDDGLARSFHGKAARSWYL